MIRYIRVHCNGLDGISMKSYVDESAAIKDFCEIVYGNHMSVDHFLSVLKENGSINKFGYEPIRTGMSFDGICTVEIA